MGKKYGSFTVDKLPQAITFSCHSVASSFGTIQTELQSDYRTRFVPQVCFRASMQRAALPPVKGPKFPPPPRKWMDLDFNQPLTTSLAAIRITWRDARGSAVACTRRGEVSANRTGNYTDKLARGSRTSLALDEESHSSDSQIDGYWQPARNVWQRIFAN